MDNYRIFLTGAQGTGKTTQVNEWINHHPEYSIIKNNRRQYAKDGIISVNKEAAPWDEIVIAGDVMLGILSTSIPCISDRSWVDKCAYASCLTYAETVLESYIRAFPGLGDKDLYFYFPIVDEVPLKGDDVRSDDVQYQREVDFYIQFFLNYFKIPYYTLTETSILARHFEIERFIGIYENQRS